MKAPKLFGTNGIRGIVGETINVNLAYAIGSSVGTLYPRRSILVGRDGRSSSLMLLEAVTAGLLAQGDRVEDCGMITTPGLQFLVKETGAAGAVMVTASHNPPNYNGFKVVDSDGIEIPRLGEERIESLVQRGSWRASTRAGSRSQNNEPLESYFTKLRVQVKQPEDLARIKVVVDTANGVAALTTPVFLRRLGCHVITLNDNIDGTFPGRDSEPTMENLAPLSALVRSEGADFGIGHDGDGDRAMFVDETGTVQTGDRSLALIEDEVLKKHPGAKMVTPVNSSMAISEITQKRHGKLIQTKVGSIHVARTMISKKAILGGEENGGIFYAPHQPVRDGTMAAILILNAIAENKMPLSKLMARLPRYYMAKEKIHCKDSAKERAIAKLKKRLGRMVTSDLDGVKVELKDRGWFLVRASGTEPLIRMTAEGKTESDLRSILSEFKPLVTKSLK